MFSNGRSSRSSCATRERSSGSSNITAIGSNGRSSVCRSAVGGGSAVIGSTVGAGAASASVLGAASPASGVSAPSTGISSRSGFSRSSFCTTSWSSSVESCRSWIACWSSGVMTTRWLCRRERRASMAMADRSPPLEGEPVAEVDLARDGVVGDLGGGAGHQNPAIVEDVRAIGDRERLTHVVVRDEDPDAALAQPADDLLDVADRDRVDARERLVEQQVLRRRDERACDLEPPPLAARERVGGIRRQRCQVELGQELARSLPALVARQVKRLEDRQKVLLDGELAEDR